MRSEIPANLEPPAGFPAGEEGSTDEHQGCHQRLIKVMSWYDNEWGYANQMLREALALTGGGRS